MTYESVVRGSRDVKAPDVETKGRNAMRGPASDTMVDTLKDVDRKARVSIRALQGVYALMILLATGFAILEDDGIVRGALGFFTLAFVLVVITQQLRYRAYSESYLGVTPVEYLRSAKKRMRVFTVRTWLAIPTWLFIDAGLCLLVYAASEHFEISVAHVILSLQGLLAIAIALDFLSEYLIWKKNHEPVVVEVDRMLGEIEASLAAEA